MTRESVADKAARLLREGRLTVLHRDGDRVTAVCHGDSGTYHLGHSPDRPGVWSCSCPAVGRCAHTVALMLVVIPSNAPRRNGDHPESATGDLMFDRLERAK